MSDIPELARKPRILDEFIEHIRRCGLTGEERAAKIIFLTLCSRFLDRPLCIILKGPSSAGKSYIVMMVLPYFPKDAYVERTGMSEKALVYSDEKYVHRILIIYEAQGIQGETGAYFLRSLLSEGRIRYEVTVGHGGVGYRTVRVEQEGPTGVILTTTKIKLYEDDETRILSVPVDDTAEQTRQIMRAIARETDVKPDFGPWHELQAWLKTQNHAVVIPYAEALAEAIPTVAIRLRRDFTQILTLIKSHALLHQATRETDDKGRIVASLEDYEVVRSLIADLVADAAEASVPATVRETVEAVRALNQQGTPAPSLTTVAEHLGLDKSTTSRRVKAAIERGFLVNLEERQGVPALLMLGKALPDDQDVLPSVEKLAAFVGNRCTVASISESDQMEVFEV